MRKHAQLEGGPRSPARLEALVPRARRIEEEDGVPRVPRLLADVERLAGDTLRKPAVQAWVDSPRMAPPPPRDRRISSDDTVGRLRDRPPDTAWPAETTKREWISEEGV
jgi:hypothetical protein